MNDTDFQAARAALREARRSGRCLERVEPAWVPPDLARAMDLQRSVAADLGAVRGWKISGLTAEQQRAMGVTTPIAAPLLDPWVRPTRRCDLHAAGSSCGRASNASSRSS